MALNVTTAVFGENCNTATASPSLAQWDTEQVLQISGIELPDSYKVEFSTVYTRNAIPEIGDASGVAIPNVLLQRSAPITAYVVLYGENGGRNREYWITIHITPGQPPETITPDPEQADVIDQAIAALNNGVAKAEAAATSAEGSASDAADHAADAEAWAVGQRSGEDVPDTDPTYSNNAKYYAGAAEAAAEEAGRHEASWESWVRRAETAADDAEGSARAAAGSKADAETAAQTATQKATEAGNSAAAAAGSASEARQTVDGAIGAINTAKEGALTAIGSAGSNAVGAVEQAGTTQTGRVTNEGDTQVNRVQTKGDEVIGSIPQDYTDLADDVADLSRQISDVESAITDLEDVLATPIYGKNFLNPSEVTSDHYINWTNGEEAYNTNYVCSDFIKVFKGVTYGFSGTKSHFAFYDDGKNYIKKTTANDITELNGGSVTITSGSAPGQYFVSPIDGYIRYSMNVSTVPVGRRVFMAIQSSADLTSTTYPAYVDDVNIEPIDRHRIAALESETESINMEVDELAETVSDNFMISPNLLNISAVADGYFLLNTGATAENASYVTTDYIPCEAGDTIRYQFDYRGTRYDNTQVAGYTKMRFIDAYDSAKTYISGSYQTNQTTYTCPQNTAFVRISFTKSSFNAGDFSNAAIIISDSANVIPFYPYAEIIGFVTHVDAYLPKHIYCAVGRTIEIYNNQVCLQADEYHVRWDCTIGKALARKFSITGVEGQIGEYSLGFTLFNDDSVVLWSGNTTLHVVSELDLQSTYSICPIGDSLTNAKQWMPEVMNLSDNSVAFVGTYSATAQDSDGVSKTFQHEGRSGFSAYNYIAGSPYTFGGATETPHNKFWDGSTFSWSHYKATYSINPDAVMVWLGTNGITLDNTANAGYIKDIVDIIRADDPNIPIYVCNTIYRGNQNALGEQTATDGYAPNKGAWNYQEKQKVMNLMQILDGLISGYQNVHLINLALSHDSEYNYGAISTPVNPRAVQTELMPIEATHPQAQGYFQIADIVYSVLSATIS